MRMEQMGKKRETDLNFMPLNIRLISNQRLKREDFVQGLFCLLNGRN